MKKTDIANQIKKFMYDSQLTDKENSLYVLTSSYLKTVLYSAYSENRKENPYSIIVGDFNKLNDLNKLYGMEEGDKCIKRVLKIINEILPENSFICRNGGDEFLFIIEGEDQKEKIEKYIDDINKEIQKNEEEIHGLTICLGCGISNEDKSLKKLHKKIDEQVEEKKMKLHIENNRYYNAYDTIYSALRLSDEFSFSNQQMKYIINIAIKATINMLENYKETGKLLAEDEKDDEIDEEKYKSSLNMEEAKQFNETFMKEHIPTEEELNNIPITELMSISKDLIYCYAPSAFSKDYYNNYLKEALIYDEYKLCLLNLSGLKLANLLYGHNCIDEYLSKNVYSNVKENVDSEVPLEKSLFSATGDCFKIYLGGGDILYIEHPDSHYRPKREFYEKNKQINKGNENELLSYILQYVKISSTSPVKKDQILDFVDYAREQTKAVKDQYKDAIFYSGNIIDIAYKCLLPDLKIYCRMHPDDYMKSNNVRDFIRKQCETMIEHKPIQTLQENEEDKTNLFLESDYHLDTPYPTTYEEYIKERNKEEYIR